MQAINRLLNAIVLGLCLVIYCSSSIAQTGTANQQSNPYLLTTMHQLELPIHAHPSKIIPAILNKKQWLGGYISLTHLSGPRWEVGEVTALSFADNGHTVRQIEQIVALEWERQLVIKFSSAGADGYALYTVEPTAKGVLLGLRWLQTTDVSGLARNGDFDHTIFTKLHRRNLREALVISHRQLKNQLELEALRESQ
jgi:hypothetical protein